MLTAHRLSYLRNFQPLFSALEFELLPSEILHLTGPNGAGKSTLLHILVGLILPYEGEVCWQGLSVHDALSDYHNHLLYLGHKIGIKANLTVLENLQLAAKLNATPAAPDWEFILAQFKIQDLKNTLCGQLSAGQKQRVALSRLLLSEATLWILDEPFTALDAETSAILQALLVAHSQQGKMTILTSHHALNWQGALLRQLAL
jgi:heme exporter protein A